MVDENVNPHVVELAAKRPRPSLDSGYGQGDRSLELDKVKIEVEEAEDVKPPAFCVPDSEDEVEEMLGRPSSGQVREQMVAEAMEKEREKSTGAASARGVSATSEVRFALPTFVDLRLIECFTIDSPRSLRQRRIFWRIRSAKPACWRNSSS